MSKNLESDGKEYVDGKPVEIYDAKFKGTFGMDEVDASPITSGDEVFFIVTATAQMPSFSSPSKVKGLKRTNVFSIDEAMLVSREKLMKMLDDQPREEPEL